MADSLQETYLFRAACSELRTEISNSRKKTEETMRRERTLLQHEVDILNQKLTQELLALKDELKGMFDDRKMDVRMEQRAMESKVSDFPFFPIKNRPTYIRIDPRVKLQDYCHA